MKAALTKHVIYL